MTRSSTPVAVACSLLVFALTSGCAAQKEEDPWKADVDELRRQLEQTQELARSATDAAKEAAKQAEAAAAEAARAAAEAKLASQKADRIFQEDLRK